MSKMSTKPRGSKFIGVMLPSDLFVSIKQSACAEDRTISGMVRVFLAEGVRHHFSVREVCDTSSHKKGGVAA